MCENARVWQNPESGIIIGEVEVIAPGKFNLKDIDNKVWSISYKSALAGKEFVYNENRVKIIGKMINKDEFLAQEIRESRCGCGHKDCNCFMNERKDSSIRNTQCGANN